MASDTPNLSSSNAGFVWNQPLRRRIATAALIGATAAVIVAGIFAVFRYGDPTIPSRFDHSAWAKHPGWRGHMLSDVLTNKVCPGTPRALVEALLGRPASTQQGYPSGSPRTFVYDIGLADPLYVDFNRTRSHRVVVYSVLPPFWPPTGCWA